MHAETAQGTGAMETAAQRIRREAKEATRRALLEGGLAEMISRGGLDAPSVDAICARAGYTRGAFYAHFRDRDHFEAEILEWALNDILTSLWMSTFQDSSDVRTVVRRFAGLMVARDWPDLHGDIRAGYLAVLRAIITGGQEVKQRHADLMAGIVGTLEHAIRSGAEEGTLRADIDPKQVAMTLLLTAIASIVWDDVGVSLDNRGVAEALIAMMQPP